MRAITHGLASHSISGSPYNNQAQYGATPAGSYSNGYGNLNGYRAPSPYNGVPTQYNTSATPTGFGGVSNPYSQTVQQEPNQRAISPATNPLAQKFQQKKLQAELTQKLLKALSRKDINAIGVHLREGADPNAAGKLAYEMFQNDAETLPIIVAAYLGNNAIIQLLLDNGAQVNAIAPQSYFRTALNAAIQRRNVESVELLLINGADPNGLEMTSEGLPLKQAARMNNFDMMSMLIEAGADVNAKHKYGGTALDSIAQSNNPKLITLLLNNGADVDALDTYKRTVLDQTLQSAR